MSRKRGEEGFLKYKTGSRKFLKLKLEWEEIISDEKFRNTYASHIEL